MPSLRPQRAPTVSTATPHSTSPLFSGQGSSAHAQQHSPDELASATDTLAGLLGPGDDSHAMPFSDAACATAVSEEEALGDALAIEWKHEREILRENAQWPPWRRMSALAPSRRQAIGCGSGPGASCPEAGSRSRAGS